MSTSIHVVAFLLLVLLKIDMSNINTIFFIKTVVVM